MIHEVQVEGFQALSDVRAPLERLTVVVGANPTGKSSFLDALAMLARAREGDQEERILERTGGHRHLWTDGARTLGSTAAIRSGAGTTRHKVVLTWGNIPGGGWGVEQAFNGSRTDLTPDTREAAYERVGLGRAVRLRLDATVLARPALPGRDYKEVAANGEGFAAVLQDIQRGSDGDLERIAEPLSGVVPSTFGVRTKRVTTTEGGRREPAARAEVRIGGPSGEWCPAEHLSEGTLLALAILTTLQAPVRPKLLLLDDIDRGLDPFAKRELIACLRRLQAGDDSLQLLCTTHSPCLLDEFTPEEIGAFKLDDLGPPPFDASPTIPMPPSGRGSSGAVSSGRPSGEDWVLGQ